LAAHPEENLGCACALTIGGHHKPEISTIDEVMAVRRLADHAA
jgi:hypothetical protein